MTNSIGYANPAGASLSTYPLEKLNNTPHERRQATAVVQSWLPAHEARDVLEALGLLPPRPGRE
ncbi:hypothetical protein QYM46_13090 [Brevibacterium sp. K11IcPPYGO002]|uniref:hypothetical protein n=1 Tax=Brevibacterium sp. K11IcPPYGO002 TaxID=3058837 RepID=UPI003D818F68